MDSAQSVPQHLLPQDWQAGKRQAGGWLGSLYGKRQRRQRVHPAGGVSSQRQPLFCGVLQIQRRGTAGSLSGKRSQRIGEREKSALEHGSRRHTPGTIL